VWLSASLALAAAVLATEVVNGMVYVVTVIGSGNGGGGGDGDINISAGGLLQVLMWVVFGIEAVFGLVVMGALRDGRGGRGGNGDRRIDFERGWKEFEDEHIIVI
jgi:hypothetical protein